jgi:hypothetical protein
MAEGDHDLTNIAKAIHELMEKDPFVPFRIVMTSGKEFLIERGGNLVEMRTEYFYALPGGDDFAFLRKNQIATVEGSKRKRPERRKAS